MKWLGRLAVGFATTAPVLAAGCSRGSHPASPASTACGDYYDAVLAGTCPSGPTLPASEQARERALFVQVCQSGQALPGNQLTDAALEACVSAVRAAGCTSSATPSECNFTGTLAAGTACNESFQCVSGLCFQLATVGEAGAAPPDTTCGTCQPLLAVGTPCSASSCVPGAVCDLQASQPTCVIPSVGSQGAACDGLAKVCGAGLYCEATTSTCQPTLAVGQACTAAGDCTPPAGCRASTCAAPGEAGDSCQVDTDCASGLGCGQSATCGAVTWVSGGEACGDLVRCLVGSCSIVGMCPVVIADGQSCADPTATCDDFSTCTANVCVLEDSDVCM
ncbi:MAG: hypothetical protein ABSE49_27885 [Polyangiaceae bacterium]